MRLISYYGDDFTGSTDVMEALESNGVKTVLFTRMPTASEFEPFTSYKAFGLAGTSRSEPPQWMDETLPQAFTWLKSLNARFVHYKVCSTFDSAPRVGNIGRAIEIGARVFNQAMVPLIVGAPQLKRYTFAGHLFAGYQGEIYRIDRHPVMSRHPVTPMHESDIRLHLAKQTGLKTQLANLSWPEAGIALLDVHDQQTQRDAGQRLFTWGGGFIAGSSGVEYALVKANTQQHEQEKLDGFPPVDPATQIIIVSGSVSPTTDRQISHAVQHGFETVPVNPLALVRNPKAEVASAVARALEVLETGKSPLICTARGPSTDEGAVLNTLADSRKHIGQSLGTILRTLVEKTGLRRAIVAGGDSSSHALSQLDIFAMTTRRPLPATPGSPLCTVWSGNPLLNGLELALKGGQLGGDDYFVALKTGTV
jgi:3-oxoisoapionate kinase